MTKPTIKHLILIPIPLTMLAGCPSSENDSVKLVPVDTAYRSTHTPCSSTQPSLLDIPGDTALSPRADAEAEQLAFEASCSITATEVVYQRVSAELTGIRAAHSESTSAHASAPYDSNSLLIGMDDAGYESLNAGTYHDWDALNQAYRTMIQAHASNVSTLNFEGRYNIPLLAKQYAQLPHVTYTDPNMIAYPACVGCEPPQRDVCLAIDQDQNDHYYLFTTDNAITASFRVDADGNIYSLDPHEFTAANPLPDWYQSCLTWIN